ncbi:MAG: hypothetical protein A2Z95_01235 [Gallionellales bacterium GWA2_60_18]|nr:MAG: hypothetical protein A2Z95_01235 [Gallionellales bacterium GWA2_60_18]
MNKSRLLILLLAGTAVLSSAALGARISDVRGTKHNFSSAADSSATPSGGTVPVRTVKATSETQICAFCHTPHGATPGVTPLWNRKLSTATYTPYSSNSLDANQIQGALDQPGGSSKLCLSCHDGTLAIGSVNVLNGAGSDATQGTQSIAMSGGVTTMPVGSGSTTGFTRLLGADLSNDHPISVTFNDTLANRDGELRVVDANQKWPSGTGETIGVRSSGYKPKLPLEPTGASSVGQVQCASCHDPHIRESDTSVGNQKFLRRNRFQAAQPTASYSETNDILCLSCHDKGGDSWAYSAHANSLVADETYNATPAATREFPTSLPVWKAACLNCHDTHTIPGARRLLRESTDNTSTPKAGGNSAIEETCYQCHSASGTSIVTPLTTVPDIKTDFALTYKMPITSTNQPAGTEKHDIGGNFNDATFVDCTGSTNKCGKDFLEARSLLGVGALTNRHAECTDCHNPHRVVRFKDFRGAAASGSLSGTPDASGTHPHTDASGYTHSNIASGVLRGSWGVEPTYSSNSFHALPSGYTVKRGDPGTSTDSSASATYVTREYQICLKCHSDYGYTDNNTYPSGNRPTLGSFTGGTASGTNGLTIYTNQAKEFQAPASHADEPLNLGNDGGSVGYNNGNHRSWHPVMAATGRTAAKRNVTATSAWRVPWSNAVGTQTMYCTDCHGSNVTSSTSVIPNSGENGSPWGPHGSANPFLLKGAWTNEVDDSNAFCMKCHNPTSSSGFSGGGKGNLHSYHDGKVTGLECSWCHVAVPHGWKNRSFLVNLNDVGEEAGQGAGSSKEVAINGNSGNYTQEPYYMQAKLKIASFATSGSWADTACGSAGKSGTGLTTGIIANSQGGTGNTTGTGKNWMTNTCNPPP